MAATTAPVAGSHRAALPAPAGRASFAGTLRSEFTKIRSVRSTYWSLLMLVVLTVGIGALASWGEASHWNQVAPADRANFDPTAQSLVGLYLSQLVIVVLGAMIITSEYSTGMLGTSLTAMPRRGVLYTAKAIVFTAVALGIGLVTSFVSFFVGQALMSSKHIDATLSQPHVLRAVVGGGLFIAGCGLLAFGIGAILRHTAGAITTSIALLFVVDIVVNFLPHSWRIDLSKWMPSNAGSQIWVTRPGDNMFSAWAGFGVFAAYAAIAVIAGVILFRKRDV
jgi:ABC-type transport system involved in multi-copper enzyme maturation permease subunit